MCDSVCVCALMWWEKGVGLIAQLLTIDLIHDTVVEVCNTLNSLTLGWAVFTLQSDFDKVQIICFYKLWHPKQNVINKRL